MTTAPAPELSQGSSPSGGTTRREPAWRLVALREIVVSLTDRNFLISTAITLVVLIGTFGIQGYLAGRSHSYTVGVTTPAARAVLESAAAIEKAAGGNTVLTVTDVATRSAGEAAVRSDTLDALFVEQGSTWQLVGHTTPEESLRTVVDTALQTRVLSSAATALGTSSDALMAQSRTGYVLLASDAENSLSFQITGLVFAMLFYMSSILFGMGIANSVVQEKQSRIVEILAAMIPLRSLLTGKIVGSGILALGQLTLYVGVGLLGLSMTKFRDLIPAVAGAAGWFLLFFIVGFAALACLWAMAGAMATRSEDLQSTSAPISTSLMVALFAGIFLDGGPLKIISFVPIMSSVAMPRRILLGGVMWWEPVLSLGLTAAFAVLTVGFGAGIYRRSLLQTHGRLSLRQAMALEE